MDRKTKILTISDCRECPFMRRSALNEVRPEFVLHCKGTGKIIGCRTLRDAVPIPEWCPLVEADETFDERVIAATDAARKESSNGQS